MGIFGPSFFCWSCAFGRNDVGTLGAGGWAPHRHPGLPETMALVVMGNKRAMSPMVIV